MVRIDINPWTCSKSEDARNWQNVVNTFNELPEVSTTNVDGDETENINFNDEHFDVTRDGTTVFVALNNPFIDLTQIWFVSAEHGGTEIPVNFFDIVLFETETIPTKNQQEDYFTVTASSEGDEGDQRTITVLHEWDWTKVVGWSEGTQSQEPQMFVAFDGTVRWMNLVEVLQKILSHDITKDQSIGHEGGERPFWQDDFDCDELLQQQSP